MNTVNLIGNLTKPVNLKQTNSGTTIAKLRVAVNERVKSGDEWTDRANYFDVTAFGNLAELCGKYTAKGSKVGITGRLHWHEWTTDDGAKRQAVDVVAEAVEFLTPKREQEQGETFGEAAVRNGLAADDDIPF